MIFFILKNAVLLFYREPITLTSLSIVISLQFPHIVRFTDTVLSLEFKDGTALALFKIFATPDILPNAKYLCTCYCLYIIFLSYEHFVEIERISFVPCHQFCLSKYIFYYLIKVNENLENSLYFLPSTPIVCVCNHGSIENILMVSR